MIYFLGIGVIVNLFYFGLVVMELGRYFLGFIILYLILFLFFKFLWEGV